MAGTDGTTRRKQLWDAVLCRFSVDLRALAALRVGLGSVLLADLLLRARDLGAFYTDAGVLPRSTLAGGYPAISRLSVHALSGAAAFQAVLFMFAGIAALALAVGYRTRLAVVVSWLLLVSLHARNPIVLNGGDSVLRRLLFWSIFLPLGARWSLDARAGRAADSDRIVSVATVGLLVQVVLVYVTNAGFKLQAGEWTAGGALVDVFRLDSFTTPVGAAVADIPVLLAALEPLWLGLLVASPLLLVLTGWWRGLFAGLFAGGHLWMLATMRLGIFPFVSLLALVPFLPGGVWDRVEALGATLTDRLPASSTLWRGASGDPDGGIDAASESETATVPDRARELGRTAASGLAAAVIVFLLCWNAMALGLVGTPAAVSATVDPADHSWDMFANPGETDVWLTAPGTLDSGEHVDAFHDRAVRGGVPPDGAAWYPAARWRKYVRSVWAMDGQVHADLTVGLCHRWERRHETDLSAVTVYAVLEPHNNETPAGTRRIELASRSCDGG